ncbi:MAG: LysR family transcriptional regulator [Silicimonas sp.]|nr:LysR family transcriptional regulator [Silicimonas sp.]
MKNEFRNWSDLRIFLAVARQGSTLAASRKLGIAQPTVARRIDALEGALGLTLFDRDTRGFKPTPEACALMKDAEAVEAAVRKLGETALDLCQARPIRITAFSANFSPRVNAIFSEFSLLHPEIRFEFLASVEVLDLMAGEADIALRLVRNPPHPDLISRHISTAQFTLYGSGEYRRKYGFPSSLNDLAGHRFVSFKRDGAASAMDEWYRANAKPEQIVQTYSEISVMYAAIVAGHGLGVANLRYARDYPDLIPCFDPPPEMNSEHLILISPDAYRRPEVKTFTKFFAPRYAAVFRD